jgi:phospholipid-binding lipoprotein MlaA
MSNLAALLAIGAGLLLAGCAGALGTNDPYEATNRQVFAFNLWVDRNTLHPTAQAYAEHVPEKARDAVHNALENLDLPVTFVNDLLQGEPTRAGQTAGRFLLNSTVGVAGLFDVAAGAGIPDHNEDFGQTLGVWGFHEGPYLVLPLFGSDPPRDAFGQAVDVAFDPSVYFRIKQRPWWMVGREYVTIVDFRTRNLEVMDDIERDSLDYYAAVRSLYRQHRENEIRNGKPPVTEP